jgi:two-component system, LytTR family, sensor kinase
MMKNKFFNTWRSAIAIILLYDMFFFVVLNILNPEGNEWTFTGFLILTGNSLISIGTLYLSFRLTQRYFKKRSLGFRYVLAFFISLPVFLGLYLFYWVFLVRLMIYGRDTDTSAYAGQLFYVSTGMYLPIACIILTSIYYSQAHKTEMQLVKTQGLMAETQLKNLQQQVDPHFLFNSLNILSALIKLDTERSVLFTQKLSEVYRFFLNTQKDLVISLQEELSFVKNYFYLVECRFGNSFQLDIDKSLAVIAENHYVIPGTIQMLVENVIKHNSANESIPIVIRIATEDDKLIVTNRVDKKENSGSGYGLNNLFARYELLNKEKVSYFEKDAMFHVYIPLIKKLS